MNFTELLDEYEAKLAYVKRMTDPDTLSFYHKTKEFWNGYITSSFNWFEDIKRNCTDFRPKMREATVQEQHIYKYVTLEDDGTSVEWPLCGILEYRKETIPVYDDDYGQQLFAVYNNQEIPGGTYNSCCEYDFCYSIDYIRDVQSFIGEEE